MHVCANDRKNLCISGGSLRLAMKNSLQETSLFEMHDPITPKRHDINIRKVNISKKAKKFEYSANPTIVEMWSEQNRSQVAIQFISKLPVEILSSFILLYLRTVELCAVRSTCRSGWDCVATYAYENHIIPLCQGQYIAQCSSLGMMAGWEYEQAGFILQEWSHPHNRACQVALPLQFYFKSSINEFLVVVRSCWAGYHHRFVL